MSVFPVFPLEDNDDIVLKSHLLYKRRRQLHQQQIQHHTKHLSFTILKRRIMSQKQLQLFLIVIHITIIVLLSSSSSLFLLSFVTATKNIRSINILPYQNQKGVKTISCFATSTTRSENNKIRKHISSSRTSLGFISNNRLEIRKNCITQAIHSPFQSKSRFTLFAQNDASTVYHNNNDNNKDEIILVRRYQMKRLKEFFIIAIPALIQLAAEPLAGLIDTIYLGRLGPAVLGGVGVAISAQYAVNKLYNDPLLRTSISLVASKDGIETTTNDTDNLNDNDTKKRNTNKEQELSIAVSTALLLALIVGIIQWIIYMIFTDTIANLMGIYSTNEMWISCIDYMKIRSFGAPAATLWLVTNGIYRGLGDTRTPLIYSLLFTILNAILDPIFIFTFHWNAGGAAAGTAIAQYIALVPLIITLHKKKVPIIYNLNILKTKMKSTLIQYLNAGGYVLFRTIGKVMSYSLCARYAALLGTISAAAYNVTFQLGFATTQICEAVAVSIQTLLAREISSVTTATTNTNTNIVSSSLKDTDNIVASDDDLNQMNITPSIRTQCIRFLINTSVIMGGGVATILSFMTYYNRKNIICSITNNIAVQNECLSIFPIVLLTQILKGFAYPVNGILMGGLDWTYSMITMWLANITCLSCLYYFVTMSSNKMVSLQQLWISLAVFMGTQVIAGIIRYESKTGIWNILRREKKKKEIISF